MINGHIWHGGTRNVQRRASADCCTSPSDGATAAPELVQKDYLTPGLHARTTPAQQYLLDIEGCQPVAAEPQ